MAKKSKNIKIQFGAGADIKKGYINVDITKEFGAEVICDMNKFPYPFPNNYADEIYCCMTLEHILYPTKAIEEFHRIIKKNGTIKIIVPHFSALYALHADNHIRNYGVGYFWQLKKGNRNLWGGENMQHWRMSGVLFENVKVDLLFPKGYLILLSLPFQLIFNSCKFMQGVYEHFFANFYRANEIHATMTGKIYSEKKK